MRPKLRLNFPNFKFAICDHFSAHKKSYLICIIFVLFGLITGILTAIKFSHVLTVEHITDTTLVSYLKQEIGWFSMLLSRMFSFLCVIALVIVLGLNKWTSIISFFILVYQAYLVGLNSLIFIILFSVSGAINVLIIYLPCHLIILTAMVSITALIFKNCWYFSKYKQNILCNNFWSANCSVFILNGAITLVAIILEIIFLPIFSSAFFLVL